MDKKLCFIINNNELYLEKVLVCFNNMPIFSHVVIQVIIVIWFYVQIWMRWNILLRNQVRKSFGKC